MTTKAPAEQVVKDIRRATRKLHSSEEKIRIVLSGLRGEDVMPLSCAVHPPSMYQPAPMGLHGRFW